MAEAFAVIGLVASITELIRLTGAVISRISEYSSNVKNLPKAFRNVQIDLPLIASILERISSQAEGGGVNDETSKALKPVIQNCRESLQSIHEIILKVTTLPTDGSIDRGIKAILSLRQEKEMEKVLVILRRQLAVLGLYASAFAKTHDSVGTEITRSSIVIIPFERDPNYLERPQLMDTLTKLLDRRNLAVLAGLGGVGKSQLAIEFCHRFREQRPNAHVLWHQVNNPARAGIAWSQTARRLGVPGHEESDADVFQLVQDYLSQDESGEWLFVLDNADDEGVLFNQDCLPSSTGHSRNLYSLLPKSRYGRIVVTTRDRRIGDKLVGKDGVIDVAILKNQEALDLLRSNIPRPMWNVEYARKLVSHLGFLPLAITQAAAFITQNGTTIDEYVQSLYSDESETMELLDQEYYDVRRDQESQTPVLQTWKLSFELIQKQRPRAIEMLSLMAILDRQGIQRNLLQKDDESRVTFNLALGILQAFSLIAIETGGQTFGMHRLVQLSTQAWLIGHQKIGHFQAEAARILLAKFPSDNVQDYLECSRLIPHAQIVSRYHFTTSAEKLDQAALLLRMADFERDCGYYTSSLSKMSEALVITRDLLGRDDEEVLKCLTMMGDTEEARGRYKAAEDLHRTVYNQRAQLLGLEDPSTLQSLSAVAGTLWLQGRYEAAKSDFETAWSAMDRILGPRHTETLNCLQNLAITYEDLGDFAKAETMHRRVLHMQMEGKNEPQPAIAYSLGNLASALHRQGDEKNATQLRKEAWGIMEQSLGPRDLITLTALGYYAGALWYEKKYAEAEVMQRRALAIRREILPPDHLDILQNMLDLSEALIGLQKYEEAERLSLHVNRVRTKILGTDHPKTMESMSNLATLMHLQGKHLQCEQMLLSLLAMRIRVLGEYHPSTLQNMDEVAGTLWTQEKFAVALEMQQRVLAARRNAQGPLHPQTLASMDTVIGSAWGQGKLAEATELLREALRLREQRYGEEDDETLIRMTRLAYLVRIQGQKVEAIDLYEKALQIYQEKLGADDPTTNECRESVSETMAERMADAVHIKAEEGST